MVKILMNNKEKRYTLVFLFILFLAGLVFAYGDFLGNESIINGHSTDEIMVKDKDGNQVSLQSLIDVATIDMTNCAWYVSSTACAVDYSSGNTLGNSYSLLPGESGEIYPNDDRVSGSMHSHCPDSHPFARGISALDETGSQTTFNKGGMAIYCCG